MGLIGEVEVGLKTMLKMAHLRGSGGLQIGTFTRVVMGQVG